jgi:hypothetical protein
VNVRLYGQDGLPKESARVTAKLKAFDLYSGYVIPQETTGITDADGLCVLPLWPNELGATESSYTVKIVGTNGKTITLTTVVPNLTEAELHNISVLPPFPGKVDGQVPLEAAVEAGNIATQAQIVASAASVSALEAQALSEAAQATTIAARDAASVSAGTATTQAGIATTQAGIATTQAGIATTQAGIATTQAGIASAAAANANVAAVGTDLLGDNDIGAVAGALVNINAVAGDLPNIALKVNRSGDTMTGPLVVPAAATGLQAVPANETVRLLGGAANLPTWTTAGRPASPADGYFGKNTDLGCIEFWDAGFVDWIQVGWQRSSPLAASGSSVELSGIPPWAKKVRLAILDGSGTANGIWIFRAGTSLGVASTGYAGYSITFTGATISATNNTTDWRAITTLAAGTYQGYLEISLANAATNTWEGGGMLSRSDSNTGGLFQSRVALAAALDRIEVTPPGNFDGSTNLILSWSA